MKLYSVCFLLLTFPFAVQSEEKISDYVSFVYTKVLADCSGKYQGALEFLKTFPKSDDLEEQISYLGNRMAGQYIVARFLMSEIEPGNSKRTVDLIADKSKEDMLARLKRSNDIKIVKSLLIQCVGIDNMRLGFLKNKTYEKKLIRFTDNLFDKNK